MASEQFNEEMQKFYRGEINEAELKRAMELETNKISTAYERVNPTTGIGPLISGLLHSLTSIPEFLYNRDKENISRK